MLVSELLDYTGAIVTEHPLQPFSQKYFTDADGLFSYSAENCLASGTAVEERNAPAPFIAAKIGEPEAEWQRLDNATLRSFFGNPSKFLIRERLGLRLPRQDSLLEEAEPLEPGGLAKYKLEQDLLDRALAGEEFEPWFPVARAGGELPPGRAGESHLRELSENARLFAEAVRANAGQRRGEPEQLQLSIGRFELSARIDNLFDGRLVRRRLTTRKPGDLLGAWIDHLLMNCVRSTESILITATREKQPVIERFAPVEDAQALLASLLDFYWQGLRAPLPFFPRSSLAFAERKLHPTRGSVPAREGAKNLGRFAAPARQRFRDGTGARRRLFRSGLPQRARSARAGISRDRNGDFRAGPQGHDEGDMNDFSLLETEIGSGPLLIEASAGTGKTFTIAGLVLRLLLERPDLTIDKILVTTFTELATAELRGRIRDLLRDALAGFQAGKSDHDLVGEILPKYPDHRAAIERLTDALANFDEAPIYTIHGFCQRVLAEQAFETGTLFDAELVTDERDLLREVTWDFWRSNFLLRRFVRRIARDSGQDHAEEASQRPGGAGEESDAHHFAERSAQFGRSRRKSGAGAERGAQRLAGMCQRRPSFLCRSKMGERRLQKGRTAGARPGGFGSVRCRGRRFSAPI